MLFCFRNPKPQTLNPKPKSKLRRFKASGARGKHSQAGCEKASAFKPQPNRRMGITRFPALLGAPFVKDILT